MVLIHQRHGQTVTAADHVSATLSSCSRMMHALRVLRDHGMQPGPLHDVYRATVLAKILYCSSLMNSKESSAWSGLTSASDRNRIDAFLRKSKRLEYCDVDTPPVTDLFATAVLMMGFSVISSCRIPTTCYNAYYQISQATTTTSATGAINFN